MGAIHVDDPVLEQIVQRLVDAFEPEAIYLFGSQAREEEGPDSDYDLMVVVSESGEPGYRRAQQAQEALWGIWVAADVVVLTRAEFERQRQSRRSLASMAVIG